MERIPIVTLEEAEKGQRERLVIVDEKKLTDNLPIGRVDMEWV